METTQILKVGISRIEPWLDYQFFVAKMTKDGRIFIPQLTMSLLQKEKSILGGDILAVSLTPSEDSPINNK